MPDSEEIEAVPTTIFRRIGDAFVLAIGDDMCIYAIRNKEPKFCLRGASENDAIKRGAEALAFAATTALDAHRSSKQGDG